MVTCTWRTAVRLSVRWLGAFLVVLAGAAPAVAQVNDVDPVFTNQTDVTLTSAASQLGCYYSGIAPNVSVGGRSYALAGFDYWGDKMAVGATPLRYSSTTSTATFGYLSYNVGAMANGETWYFHVRARYINGSMTTYDSNGVMKLDPPAVTGSALAVGQVGQPFQYLLSVASYTPVFAVTSGPLPDGLALNSVTYALTGTPTVSNVWSVDFYATNQAGQSAPLTVVITINPAVPVVTSTGVAPGMVGAPFNYQITADNGPTGFSAIGLPAGLVLEATTGLITGMPRGVGSSVVNLGATNVSGTGTGSITLQVAAPPPPAVTSLGPLSGAVGQLFSQPITGSGYPTAFTASGLPQGLVIDPTTGVISGRPAQAGTFPVTVRVQNLSGADEAVVSVTIAKGTPTLTWPAPASIACGVQLDATQLNATATLPGTFVYTPAAGNTLLASTQTLQVLFTPADTKNYSSTNATTSISVTKGVQTIAFASLASRSIGEAPFALAGTVNSGLPLTYTSSNPAVAAVTGGTVVITGIGITTITATQTGDANWQPAASVARTLSVLPMPPVLRPDAVIGHQNQPFNYQILATNNPTFFNATNLPPGLSVNVMTGVIAGTPTMVGVTQVGISASNTGGTGSQILTLRIIPTAPVITNPGRISGRVGSVLYYVIQASGNPTFYDALDLPQGLAIDKSTGILSGTPVVAGEVVVTLVAANEGGTSSAWLTITTLPIPPVITSASSLALSPGSPLVYQIAASGSPTSFAASALPTGLVLDPATGRITGTLTAGIYYSVVSATNAGGTGSQNLTITVALPVDPVIALVTRFYQQCLARTPDPGGLAGWTGYLRSKAMAGADVARAFILSPEFLSRNLPDGDFLDALYRAFFGREPDAGGKGAWKDALAAGMSREDVLYGFILAPEFARVCTDAQIEAITTAGGQRYAVRQFVRRFYRRCLGREPDAGGITLWTDALLDGSLTGSEVANGFLLSPEFTRRGIEDEAFLTVLYQAFFDRDPDAGGRRLWLDQVARGMSRLQVITLFTRAQEFTDLCTRYGIFPFRVSG